MSVTERDADVARLAEMMQAAAIPLPVYVEYDEDGGGEYGPYSRWAYRIPGVCGLADEVDGTWPGLVASPDHEGGQCPRSEYLAALINTAPALVERLEQTRAELEACRRLLTRTRSVVAFLLDAATNIDNVRQLRAHVSTELLAGETEIHAAQTGGGQGG